MVNFQAKLQGALIGIAVLLLLWGVYWGSVKYADCDRAGGVLVRGALFTLECVQAVKPPNDQVQRAAEGGPPGTASCAATEGLMNAGRQQD